MKTFFICALPRSRTAWLANFLSYGPSFCFHEPFAEYQPLELPKVFSELTQEYIGISDSMASLFIDDLLKLFPSSKIVVVRRPVEEVAQRLLELSLPATNFVMQLDHQLNYIEREYTPLVIDFHAFDPAWIWEYLIPEVPVDQRRLKMLEDFNVTVPIERAWRKGHNFIKRIQAQMTR